MATFQLPRLYSLEEYEQLPGELGVRSELIDGELVLSPFAAAEHSKVIKRLERQLESWVQSQPEPLAVVRESGLHIPSASVRDSVPGPDLMVLRNVDYDRASSGAFEGTPLFVVEIISPSETRMRRMQKVGLYLDAGISAVVEIDYTRRTALIHRLNSALPTEVPVDGSFTEPFPCHLPSLWP